jgi:hypothetical protein
MFDSKINSSRFDCCEFLLASCSSPTFATKSAISGLMRCSKTASSLSGTLEPNRGLHVFDLVVEVVGIDEPIWVAVGISSRSNSSLFPTAAVIRKLTPVMLPSGRLRLVTRPSFTGSPLMPKTTGIVVFAVLSASWTATPPSSAPISSA